ncbi:hypothetical protein [Maricaulis sp. CAU 1757]
MVDHIKDAIARRIRIHVHYGAGYRLIEPHALGISTTGNWLLRAYQVSGASASGEAEGWKLLRFDRFGPFSTEPEEPFSPRPGYRRDDPVMKGGIVAQI